MYNYESSSLRFLFTIFHWWICLIESVEDRDRPFYTSICLIGTTIVTSYKCPSLEPEVEWFRLETCYSSKVVVSV